MKFLCISLQFRSNRRSSHVNNYILNLLCDSIKKSVSSLLWFDPPCSPSDVTECWRVSWKKLASRLLAPGSWGSVLYYRSSGSCTHDREGWRLTGRKSAGSPRTSSGLSSRTRCWSKLAAAAFFGLRRGNEAPHAHLFLWTLTGSRRGTALKSSPSWFRTKSSTSSTRWTGRSTSPPRRSAGRFGTSSTSTEVSLEPSSAESDRSHDPAVTVRPVLVLQDGSTSWTSSRLVSWSLSVQLCAADQDLSAFALLSDPQCGLGPRGEQSRGDREVWQRSAAGAGTADRGVSAGTQQNIQSDSLTAAHADIFMTS